MGIGGDISSVLGGAGLGLTWGWLTGGALHRSGPSVRAAVSSVLATGLLSAQVLGLTGALPALINLVACALGAWLYTALSRELRNRLS